MHLDSVTYIVEKRCIIDSRGRVHLAKELRLDLDAGNFVKLTEDKGKLRLQELNKRKHKLYELTVNESEAAVVRLIYDKYVHEGYGAQRIASYLNNLGYQTRAGKPWHHSTIRAIF